MFLNRTHYDLVSKAKHSSDQCTAEELIDVARILYINISDINQNSIINEIERQNRVISKVFNDLKEFAKLGQSLEQGEYIIRLLSDEHSLFVMDNTIGILSTMRLNIKESNSDQGE